MLPTINFFWSVRFTGKGFLKYEQNILGVLAGKKGWYIFLGREFQILGTAKEQTSPSLPPTSPTNVVTLTMSARGAS